MVVAAERLLAGLALEALAHPAQAVTVFGLADSALSRRHQFTGLVNLGFTVHHSVLHFFLVLLCLASLEHFFL